MICEQEEIKQTQTESKTTTKIIDEIELRAIVKHDQKQNSTVRWYRKI